MIRTRNISNDTIEYFTRKNSPNLHAYRCALATSSAPTFFEPCVIDENTYVDGGTDGIHNNPTSLAWLYSRVSLHKKKKNVHIISLGTGAPQKNNPTNNSSSIFYPITLLKQSFFNKYSGEDVNNLIGEEFNENQYTRLQFQLSDDYQLDNIYSVDSLKKEAKSYAKSSEGSSKIQKVVSMILSNKYGIHINDNEKEHRVTVNKV